MWRFFVFSVTISSAFCGSIPTGLVPIYDSRIVGGQEIAIDEVPYMAAVVYYGAQWCGGTIISKDVILTAAHCIPGLTERRTKIRVGSSSRSTGGKLLPIRKILPHQNYESYLKGYDIALIWLDAPLIFSNTVKMIMMPEQDDVVVDGSMAVVSGWGYLTSKGPIPDLLRAINVPTVNRQLCRKAFQEYINEQMICAGYKEGGKDACQMDSGGPMVVGNTIVGIVSWGNGCATPDFYGVYSNVAYFRNWISDQIVKFT